MGLGDGGQSAFDGPRFELPGGVGGVGRKRRRSGGRVQNVPLRWKCFQSDRYAFTVFEALALWM